MPRYLWTTYTNINLFASSFSIQEILISDAAVYETTTDAVIVRASKFIWSSANALSILSLHNMMIAPFVDISGVLIVTHQLSPSRIDEMVFLNLHRASSESLKLLIKIFYSCLLFSFITRFCCKTSFCLP